MKYRVLLVMLLIPLAHAEIYKWVDDEGKVHFSDSKPMNRPAEQQNYTGGESKLDPEMEKHRHAMDVQRQEWELQEALDQEARKQAEQKKKRDEHNCNVAKSNLAMDDQVSIVYTTNADGSRRALTAEERRKRREAFLLKKEEYCH